MKEIDIIISRGKVLTVSKNDDFFENGSIAIDNDTIIAIGSADEIENQYRGKTIVEANGCLVMPGLVNCHTHAAMTCFRGIADDLKLKDWLNNYIFPAEAKNVDRDLAYWGSLLACTEMIKSGTTSFCDMYIFEEETARAAKQAGIRCLLGEVLFDFPSPSCPTPKDGLLYTRNLLENWADDSLISIAVEPHALYTCSFDLLKSSKYLADEFNAPLALHLLETEFERDELTKKFDGSPVTFLEKEGFLNEHFIAFHCVSASEGDIKLFSATNANVVHNPVSNMKLASGVAPIPKMLNAGITVGLGTDGCASNNTLDMFQDMDMTAKLHKVTNLDPTLMDAETVVKMATREGAKALGLSGITGMLATGMKADIILLDLDNPHLTPLYNPYSHIVYAVRGSDVKTVIINGRIVMKDRELQTINEHEVIQQVRTIAKRIIKSLE